MWTDILNVVKLLLAALTVLGWLRLGATAASYNTDNRGNKFSYTAGNIYSYRYVINGTTASLHGSEEHSGLSISSHVHFKFHTSCQVTAMMRDVQVWQSYKSRRDDEDHLKKPTTHMRFKEALEKFPLRFSINDGAIEELCPADEEPDWVLNIKRGMLSMLQNTQARLDLEDEVTETDVHGKCNTIYRHKTVDSTVLVILKRKELSSCLGNGRKDTMLRGRPYDNVKMESSIEAIKSSNECEQTVDSNLIASVTCTERYKWGSMVLETAGASTQIEQSLQLLSIHEDEGRKKEEEKALDEDDSDFSIEDMWSDEFETETQDVTNHYDDRGGGIEKHRNESHLLPLDTNMLELIKEFESGQVTRRESLQYTFDNFHSREADATKSYEDAFTHLRMYCRSLENGVSANTGEYFEKAVNYLRHLKEADMSKMFEDSAEICQDDRLGFYNVLEAVGTSASLSAIKNLIFRQLAPKVVIESWINSLTYIKKPTLGILEATVPLIKQRDTHRNIILTYSSLVHTYCTNHVDCTKERPVIIIRLLYEKYFHATKCSTSNSEELKEILVYLKGIGNLGQYSDGIRDALQQCILHNDDMEIKVAAVEAYRRLNCDADRSILSDLFYDQEIDSELRIKAFIELMRCPTYSSMKSIEEALEEEQVLQVKSFVSSYMENLKKTSLQSKGEQAKYAENIRTPVATSYFSQTFSKSYEASAFYDEMNLGVGVDGNLIFSEKSYLPRSASLNLVVDLFGESLNILETTVRIQNFERYVESWMRGNEKVSGSPLARFLSRHIRPKREVPSKRKLNELSKLFGMKDAYYSGPTMSYSLRLLGHEVFFDMRHGMEEQMKLFQSLDPFQSLKNVANQETKWQKSAQLLDSTYELLTGAGLPISFSLKSCVHTKLKSSAHTFAVRSSRTDPFEMRLQGLFEPSALIDAKASVTFGAEGYLSGVQMQARLRSSSGLKGKFHFREFNLIDAKFGLHKDEQVLLDFRSEIMLMENGEYKKTLGEPQVSTSCSSNSIIKESIGVKFCVTKLNGEEKNIWLPKSIKYSIVKSEPELLMTSLIYRWNSTKEHKRLLLQLATTTKGREDKMPLESKLLALQIHLSELRQEIQFQGSALGNSFKTTGFWESRNAAGQAQLFVSTHHGHSFVSNVTMKRLIDTATERSYSYQMRIKCNEKTTSDVQGTLFLEKGKQDAMKRFSSQMLVSCEGKKQLQLNVGGFHNKSSIESNITATYLKGNSYKELQAYVRGDKKEVDSGGRAYSISVDLKPKEYPTQSWSLAWNLWTDGFYGFKSKGELLGAEDDGTHSNLLMKIQHEVSYERHESGRLFRIIHWLSLSDSQAEPFGAKIFLKTVGRSLKSAITFCYAPDKKVETSLSLERTESGITFFILRIERPESPIIISFLLDEQDVNALKGDFKFDWEEEHKLIVAAKYMKPLESTKKEIHFNGTLDSSKISASPIKLEAVMNTSDEHFNLFVNSKLGRSPTEGLQLYFASVETERNGMDYESFWSLDTKSSSLKVETKLKLEDGFDFSLNTNFPRNIEDIAIKMKKVDRDGVQIFAAKLDKIGDSTKTYSIDFFGDVRRDDFKRVELAVLYPHSHYMLRVDSESREGNRGGINGTFRWGSEGFIRTAMQYRPSFNTPYESYRIAIQLSSSIEELEKANCLIELSSPQVNLCKLKVNGHWGDQHTFSGFGKSTIDYLTGDDEKHDEIVEMVKKFLRNLQSPLTMKPYELNVAGNLTTSSDLLQFVEGRLTQKFYSLRNMNSDVNLKLPNNEEISFITQWMVPKDLEEIDKTRIEVRLQTPYDGLKDFNLQGVIGYEEGSNVLGSAGIYTDYDQHSIVIKGTRKFKEDGTASFEILSSNVQYDKIFGSLSYAIGETCRLACQLGWPGAVVDLETRLQWNSWQDFEIYGNLANPWIPVKNINMYIKIDSTQIIETKFALNDNQMNLKCEWAITSWRSFEIKLVGVTPMASMSKFGFVTANFLQDMVSYSSQINGWINDRQIGYKLKGDSGDIAEGLYINSLTNLELEIFPLVYPTIRYIFEMKRRNLNIDIIMSLKLREGPINLEAQIEIIDVLRWNENVRITTPYSQLQKLDIDFSPAIIMWQGIYNVNLQIVWQADSQMEKMGVVVRYGAQEYLERLLTQEAVDKAYDEASKGYSYENDYEYDEIEVSVDPVDLPESQMIHVYSPISWMRLFRLEINAGDSYKDHQEIILSVDKFNFGVDVGIFRTTFFIHNLEKLKEVEGSVEVPETFSYHVKGKLDLLNEEKKAQVLLSSRIPEEKSIEWFCDWQKQGKSFFSATMQSKTPWISWEWQNIAFLYAHNEPESSFSINVDFESVKYLKTGTSVVLRPKHFSMSFSSEYIDWRNVTLTYNSQDGDGVVIYLIDYTHPNGTIHVDMERKTSMIWPIEVSGTITSSLMAERYKNGEIKFILSKANEVVEIDGQIDWPSESVTVSQKINNLIDFKEMNLKVNHQAERQRHEYQLNIIVPRNDEKAFETIVSGTTPFQSLSYFESKMHLIKSGSFLNVAEGHLDLASSLGKADASYNWSLSRIDQLSMQYIISWDLRAGRKEIESFLSPKNLHKMKLMNTYGEKKLFGIPIGHSHFLYETEEPRKQYELELRRSSVLRQIRKKDKTVSTINLKARTHEDSHQLGLSVHNFSGWEEGKAQWSYEGPLFRNSSNVNSDQINGSRMEEDKRLSIMSTESEGNYGLKGNLEYYWPNSPSKDVKLSIKVEPNLKPKKRGRGISLSVNKDNSLIVAKLQSDDFIVPTRFFWRSNITSWKHVDVMSNFSSTLKSVPFVDFTVNNDIEGSVTRGIYGATWKRKRIFLNYFADVEEIQEYFKSNYTVSYSLPFATESTPSPQTGLVHYFYEGKPLKLNSTLQLVYNDVQLFMANYSFEGMYKSKEDFEERLLKIQNYFWPAGIHYTYKHEYEGDEKLRQLPTETIRKFKLYDLENPKSNERQGQLKVANNFTGSSIYFQGSNVNRSLELFSDYDFLDHQFCHNTYFSWDSLASSRIVYELKSWNLSTDEIFDHKSHLKISYPVREIDLEGQVSMDYNDIGCILSMNMNKRRHPDGTLKNTLMIKDYSNKLRKKISLLIQHPALKSDVAVDGDVEIIRSENERSMNSLGNLSLSYSEDPNRKIVAQLESSQLLFFPDVPWYYYLQHWIQWEITNRFKMQHLASNWNFKGSLDTLHSDHDLSFICMMNLENSRRGSPKESQIAFELNKKNNGILFLISDPREFIEIKGNCSSREKIYEVNSHLNTSYMTSIPVFKLVVDANRKLLDGYLKKNLDFQDGVYIKGGLLVDRRNGSLNVVEVYDNQSVSHANLVVQMKHSKVIISRLKWRPHVFQELQKLSQQVYFVVLEASRNGSIRFKNNAIHHFNDSFNDIWKDARDYVLPFFEQMKKDFDFKEDTEALNKFFESCKLNNDFYIEDISNFAQLLAEEVSVRLSKVYNSMRLYRRELIGEYFTAFDELLEALLTQVKEVYRKVVEIWQDYWKGDSLKVSWNKFKEHILQACSHVLAALKDLWRKMWQHSKDWLEARLESMKEFLHTELSLLMDYATPVVEYIESSFQALKAYIGDIQEEIMKSTYYTHFMELLEMITYVAKNFSPQFIWNKVKQGYNAIMKNIQELIKVIIQFDERSNLSSFLLKYLKKFGLEEAVLEPLQRMYSQTTIWIKSLHLSEKFGQTLSFIYRKGISIFFDTTLERMEQKDRVKTEFIFDPEKGYIGLKQKLPFHWHHFDEWPDYKELPEFKALDTLKKSYNWTKNKILRFHDATIKNEQTSLYQWLKPKFSGNGLFIGPSYFATFDGLGFDVTGGKQCTFLLAHDMVDGKFTVAIEYHDGTSSFVNRLYYNIILSSGPETLVIDFVRDGIRNPNLGTGELIRLPVQLKLLEAYREGNKIVARTTFPGVMVGCYMDKEICHVSIYGFYTRRVSGLLGTPDLEPTTDLIYSNGSRSDMNSISKVFESWDITSSDDFPCNSSAISVGNFDSKFGKSNNESSICQDFFAKGSSLHTCFPFVDPQPYMNICSADDGTGIWKVKESQASKSLEPLACRAAQAYVIKCATNGIKIDMPTSCVVCTLNGKTLTSQEERQISPTPSTDVVMIIEAKQCNTKLRSDKHLDIFIRSLEGELRKRRIINNRYAVVAFGGNGVYDKPRIIYDHYNVFTNHSHVIQLVNEIPAGGGDMNIFNAISFSLRELEFRPGVSKTFILFPCSSCQPQHMATNYNEILYAMTANDVTLHILKNDRFSFKHKKHSRRFYGMDKNTAYTRKDAKNQELGGSKYLLDFVPAHEMGFCAPLAFDSNGSLFAGRKMQNKNKERVSLFVSLFSKRVASSANPNSCFNCKCLKDSNRFSNAVTCQVCGMHGLTDFDFERKKAEIDDSSYAYFEQSDSEEY